MFKDFSEYNVEFSKREISNACNSSLFFGHKHQILNNLENLLKETSPRLIFLDISRFFGKAKVELRIDTVHVISDKMPNNTSNDPVFIENDLNEEFWIRKISLFKKCALILSQNGFFAVKTNGTIKSSVKCCLDTIFGHKNFVNEIIVDSPFKVHYNLHSGVFERTNYVLVYTKSPITRIRPVFNNKKSGGYWHSFVSKGQGKSKRFIFKGTELILTPPPGTHWKLNQKKIIELCNQEKIRLNKNGSPEYWVPSKIGQIIDTNWLDISSFSSNSDYQFTNSIAFYKRLLNTFLDEAELLLDLSADIGNSIIAAEELKIKWIAIEQDSELFKSTIEKLYEKKVCFSAYKLNNVFSVQKHLEFSSYLDKILANSIPSQFLKQKNLFLVERFLKSGINSNQEVNDVWRNMLISGDTAQVLPLLKQKLENKVKTIYIDPPFFTGTNETIIIPIYRSKGVKQNTMENLLYLVEDLAYANKIEDNNIASFVTWFKTHVLLMKSLLRDDGLIFVRFDYHFGHYAKLILDEVFGASNFIIEFQVRRMKKNLSLKQTNHQTHLIVHSDSVFVYQKTEEAKLDTTYIKKRKRKNQDLAEIQYSNDNLWVDIAGYQKLKKTLYPTENSEILLSRIIRSSSDKGDIVADFFCGSGTTLAVAEKLARKWIGVDISSYSIHETRKRILQIPSRSSFELFSLENNKAVTNSTTPKTENNSQPKIKFELITTKKTLEIRITNFFPLFSQKISKDHEFWDYIDFWGVDWNYQNRVFHPKWFSFRTFQGKRILKGVELSAVNKYSQSGCFKVMILVVDVFGNSVKTLKNIVIT